jgi:hypothetical protein
VWSSQSPNDMCVGPWLPFAKCPLGICAALGMGLTQLFSISPAQLGKRGEMYLTGQLFWSNVIASEHCPAGLFSTLVRHSEDRYLASMC